MSLYLKTAGAFGKRTTNMGSSGTYSLCFYFARDNYTTSDTAWIGGAADSTWAPALFGFEVAGSGFATPYALRPSVYGNYYGSSWATATGAAWYFCALEIDGSDANAYVWAEATTSSTPDYSYNFTPTMTAPNAFMIGADQSFWASKVASVGKFRHVRYWNGTTLTSADFDAERKSATPVKAGITEYWPLAETDFSSGAADGGSAGDYDLTLGVTHSTNYVYDAADPTLPGGASGVAKQARFYSMLRSA
jgi:hypothetical protein